MVIKRSKLWFDYCRFNVLTYPNHEFIETRLTVVNRLNTGWQHPSPAVNEIFKCLLSNEPLSPIRHMINYRALKEQSETLNEAKKRIKRRGIIWRNYLWMHASWNETRTVEA